MKFNNPFLVAGYYSPEYFCDHRQEMEKVMSSFMA